METLIKQNKIFNEKQFIEFLINQGITVKTNTKARGNLGICFENRIDVSKNAKPERVMTILAHEYAHQIHIKIEKDSFKKGGTLEVLFNTADIEAIEKELQRVTYFVDENSLLIDINKQKEEIKSQIKELETLVKQEYPNFKRSYEFKPIKTYFRKNKSNAKYLLKYDNVKLIHPIFKKEEFYSIKTVDEDFSDMPASLRTYLKLNSLMRRQKAISRKINKAKQYYNRPTELFARFVEGLFKDKETTKNIAPNTYERFMFLLKNGHYGAMKDLFVRAGLV